MSTSVELVGLNGERLELPSESFDGVLSSWTLCTIPDLPMALDENPTDTQTGRGFQFVEHAYAPDATSPNGSVA